MGAGDFVINILIRARDEVSKAMKHAGSSLGGLSKEANKAEKDMSNLDKTMNKLGKRLDSTSTKLGELNRGFQGLQLAFVIKYFQALLSAAIALGGELVSLASSAIYAGGAIGGALVAGLAQAIPVVALLAAAFSRFTAVIKAAQEATKVHDQATQASKNQQVAHKNAIDQVTTASQNLTQAHAAETQAQKDLTTARRDAVRGLEDMRLALKRARLDDQSADLSLQDAKRALRTAELNGNLEDIKKARIAEQNAELDKTSAHRDVGRQSADLNRIDSQGGVKAMPQLIAAQKSLASAQNASADAARGLARAQRDASKAATQQNAAQQQLQIMLSKFSPAEKKLYNSVRNIQKLFQDKNGPIRGITDNIIGAFQRGVDGATSVLKDKKILSAAETLSHTIADSLDKVTKFFTSTGTRNFFVRMMGEAEKNLPLIVDGFLHILHILEKIADAAAPMFHRLIRDSAKFFEDLDKKTTGKKLKKFFDEAEPALRALVSVGGGLIDLIGAIAGIGQKQGTKDLRSLAKTLHGWADDIRGARGQVEKFFKQASDGSAQVIRVLKEIGVQAFQSFKPGQIKALADFLTNILIPALFNAIQVMGILTQVFHELLDLPVVREIAQWVVTVVLLLKAFELVKDAYLALRFLLLTTDPILIAIVAIVAAVVILDKKFHFLKPTLELIKKVGRAAFEGIQNAAESVFKWLKGHWPLVLAILTGPFGLMVYAITKNLDKIKDLFRDLKKFFSNIFSSIGQVISSVFDGVMSGIYLAVTGTIKGIVKAVNLAIGAFNKLPGPNIGKIDYNPPVSYQSNKTLNQALAGQRTSDIPDSKIAQGDMVKAKGGGVRALIAEGGYDEAVVTTDPKHADRQKGILGRLFDKAPWLKEPEQYYAKGGYVQGAAGYPPRGRAIRELANQLFAKGYNVTSAAKPRGTGTLHDQGYAIDLGDSVNNLRKLWPIVYRLRTRLAELFGPTSMSPKPTLMHYGRASRIPSSRPVTRTTSTSACTTTRLGRRASASSRVPMLHRSSSFPASSRGSQITAQSPSSARTQAEGRAPSLPARCPGSTRWLQVH
jgi:hypothetical protein